MSVRERSGKEEMMKVRRIRVLKRRRLSGGAALIMMVGFVLSAMTIAVPGRAVPVTTVTYADFTLSCPWQKVTFDEKWDLTKSDLVITYKIDLNGVVGSNGDTSWTMVGLSNLGCMCSGYPNWDANKLPEDETQDLDDKHNLQAQSGQDECSYDAIGPDTIETQPTWNPWLNYGFWFDRDGVDSDQAGYWGSVDGKTYNTCGVYDITVSYHAIVGLVDTGTMFATVNQIPQGFYDGGWYNGAPQHSPVGKSIHGDLGQISVYAANWADASSHGSVTITGLKVTGVLWEKVGMDIKPGSDPNSVCLKDTGNLPVAILGSSTLDVTEIDPSTLQLGVNPYFVDIATRGPAKAPKVAFSIEDVNGDGVLDMMAFFSVPDLVSLGGLTETATKLSLTGEMFDGRPLMGEDAVSVVNA